MAKSKNTREIKIRAFTYLQTVVDPANPDRQVRVAKLARQGEVVELEDDQIAKGERNGAFVTTADKKAKEAEESDVIEFDTTTAGVDELQEWIEEDKPSVKETVDAAEGDPEVAKRILEAEEGAHPDDARKGVVEGLAAIIGSAQD